MRITLMALLVSALVVSARDVSRYPLRQIDRPLILPAKMWQEKLTQNSYVIDNGEELQSEEGSGLGFLPGLPAYAISDNWLWTAVPAPFFTYLLTRNNINGSRPIVTDLSLALDGGISALLFTQDKWYLLYQLGLQAKLPMSQRWWALGQTGVAFDKGDLLNISGAAGLGLQWTDRLYSTTNYALKWPITRSDNFDFNAQGLFLNNGFNFNSSFSLEFGLSLQAHGLELDSNSILTWGQSAGLSFQW